MIKKTLLSLLVSIGISFVSYSQKNSNNLLWRIEGNGLSKPSYLFGTMHVRDARAFEFRDSVYYAIKSCESFATEIDMDSLFKYMFYPGEDEGIDLMEAMFEDDEIDEIKYNLKSEIGLDYDNVRNRDPFVLKYLTPNSTMGNEMKRTFVDAYLLGFARTNGKKCVGLEKVDDQFKMLEQLEAKEERVEVLDRLKPLETDLMEDMLKSYQKGNLEQMEKVISTDFVNAPEMIIRNKIMANSIDSLLKSTSLFSAVGSAHLMGDYSVIKLLEDKGYKLSPVYSENSKLLDDYVLEPKKMSWLKEENDDYGYSLESPYQMFELKLIPTMQMKMCMDICSGSYYMVMSVEIPGASGNDDDFIDTFYESMAKSDNMHLEIPEKISRNGVDGVRVKGTSELFHMHGELFIHDGILNFFMMGNKEEDMAFDSKVSSYFFDSIKFHKPDKKSKNKSSANWEELNDPVGAFSINFPSKYRSFTNYVEFNEDNDVAVKIFLGMDAGAGANFMVAYHDMPTGYFIDNQTETFTAGFEEISSDNIDIKTDTIAGAYTMTSDILLDNRYPSRIWITSRGNRVYKFLVQGVLGGVDDSLANAFINSLKFNDFGQDDSTLIQLEVGSDEITAHVNNSSETESSYNPFYIYTDYTYSSNPLSGGSFVFEKDHLSNYAYIENLDSFYINRVDDLVGYFDSLLNVEISVNEKGVKNVEFVIKMGNSDLMQRSLMYLYKDKVYTYSSYCVYEELYSEQTSKILYSHINGLSAEDIGEWDVMNSRLPIFEKDMFLGEQTTYENISEALYDYPFKAEDLNWINSRIEECYDLDSVPELMMEALIFQLGNIEGVETYDIRESIYKHSKSTPLIKESVLYGLSDFNNEKDVETFEELLFNHPPKKIEDAWISLYSFADSLPYTANNIKACMRLCELDQSYENFFVPIFGRMSIDSSRRYKADLELIENELYNLLNQQLTDFKGFDEEDYSHEWRFENYLRLSNSMFSDDFADKLSKKVIKHGDDYMKSIAHGVRINREIKVDSDALRKLMENSVARIALLDEIGEEKAKLFIDEKYFTQEFMAILEMQEYLSYDEDYADKIEVLGQMRDEGKVVYAFKIIYTWNDEEYAYLGISSLMEPGEIPDYKEANAYTEWDDYDSNWSELVYRLIENSKNYNQEADAW